MTTHYSRNKILTQNQFYDILYERLVAVKKDRANLKQRARNIAREAGKSYEDIMVNCILSLYILNYILTLYHI